MRGSTPSCFNWVSSKSREERRREEKRTEEERRGGEGREGEGREGKGREGWVELIRGEGSVFCLCKLTDLFGAAMVRFVGSVGCSGPAQKARRGF